MNVIDLYNPEYLASLAKISEADLMKKYKEALKLNSHWCSRALMRLRVLYGSRRVDDIYMELERLWVEKIRQERAAEKPDEHDGDQFDIYNRIFPASA